jgi:hypothetical protein
MGKNQINDTLFNEEFIGYINSLSGAILEYFKVSQNIIKNTELHLQLAKTEINKAELNIGLAINEKNSPIGLINFISGMVNKLEFNNKSEEQNLESFFKDAKILFKKLKEKRKELIIQSKRRSNSSQTKKSFPIPSLSLMNNKLLYKQKSIRFAENNSKSEINKNVKDLKYNVLYSKLNNKHLNLNSKDRAQFYKNKTNKEKSQLLTRGSVNNEYFKEKENELISLSGHENKSKSISPNKSKNTAEADELKRLRMINKKLSSELNKYKSNMHDKNVGNNQNNNNNNFNNFEKINIFIKDKDKVISKLKKEMNQSTIKFKDILTQYKSQIVKLQDENNYLKVNSAYSVKNSNTFSEYDKSLNSKLSTLMKENKQLKESIEEMKMRNLKNGFKNNSEQNLNSKKNINNNIDNQTQKSEIDELKNKMAVLQKYFSKKQAENKDLNNQLNILKKKLVEEKKILSNKNLELSQNLINKQNELISLQKENYNKNNEITNLKGVISQRNSDNAAHISKDEHEKIISNLKSKIKELESNIEKNKNIQLEKYQQLSSLQNELTEKDVLIQEQNNNLEQIKTQLFSLEVENKNLLNTIETLNKTISSKENDDNIINLNEQLKEQKNLNNNLNDELTKIKNDNELLKNKVISSEKKISLLKVNSDMNEEQSNSIEQLKGEIQSLKFENEKLNYQYNQLKENLGIDGEDKINKQNQEIEGLKQLIQKLQKEREKGDSEISNIKRENEKMKNQIIRLSETLPNEYNELQKQYQALEIKYKLLKKNNPNINTPNKSKTEDKQEEKLSQEVTDLKKEIEQLKKKNNELIAQLEDKEIKKNFYDNRSEDANKSNYEEEFDLRKMAKGARDKNRSQDINIDYPGIQTYKEKIRELEFYYNSLETLVKKLLLTIQCTPKNKTYVTELCRMVGFDLEMTNKIVTNKNKNSIFGLFTK